MPETSAQNKQVIRRLLADPGNKHCADCKTATHPRWTSWNIGVFLCIRCSGVHRSLGTHISKVRSIDLDSWSDAQLVELQRWGNSKANQYWEAGLPANHIPDESKIVNFIRTKYDLKRWVASEKPSPESLPTVASEDVPLDRVRESARTTRTMGSRPTQTPTQAPTAATANLLDFDDFSSAPPIPGKSQPSTGDVFGGSAPNPARYTGSKPSVTSAPAARPGATYNSQPVPKTQPAVSTAPSAAPSAIPRAPAQAAPRSDLKKSILSLYAQKPPQQRPAQPPATTSRPPTTSSNDFDLLGSSTGTSATSAPAHPSTSTGSLIDSLGGLNFGSSPSPAPVTATNTGSSFGSSFGSGFNNTSTPSTTSYAPKPAQGPTDSIVQPTAASTTFAPVEEDDFFANPWK